MHLPQFRIRTLLFMIWLSALLLAGTIDVVQEYRNRHTAVVLNERVDANGSRSATILYSYSRSYYLGSVPIGPCPTALFSGIAFVGSLVGWVRYRRGKKRAR